MLKETVNPNPKTTLNTLINNLIKTCEGYQKNYLIIKNRHHYQAQAVIDVCNALLENYHYYHSQKYFFIAALYKGFLHYLRDQRNEEFLNALYLIDINDNEFDFDALLQFTKRVYNTFENNQNNEAKDTGANKSVTFAFGSRKNCPRMLIVFLIQ